MSAYVILDINVTDPEAFEEYKKLSPRAIAAHGGRYLARGGHTEVLEGEWNPNRLVILRFDSVDEAKEWVGSAEYRKARELRHAASTANVVVIEGV